MTRLQIETLNSSSHPLLLNLEGNLLAPIINGLDNSFFIFSHQNSLGVITFSMIKLFLNPLIIDLSIDFFISTLLLLNNSNNNEKFTIMATIQECFLGEVYNDMIFSCVKCPWGSYSFGNRDKICKICPKEAIFCFENIVSLKIGFWRSSNFDILPCQPYSASCLLLLFNFVFEFNLFRGGNESLCDFGYDGPMCQSCNFSFSKNGFECLKCGEKSIEVLKSIAPFFMTFVLIFFAIM